MLTGPEQQLFLSCNFWLSTLSCAGPGDMVTKKMKPHLDRGRVIWAVQSMWVINQQVLATHTDSQGTGIPS